RYEPSNVSASDQRQPIEPTPAGESLTKSRASKSLSPAPAVSSMGGPAICARAAGGSSARIPAGISPRFPQHMGAEPPESPVGIRDGRDGSSRDAEGSARQRGHGPKRRS